MRTDPKQDQAGAFRGGGAHKIVQNLEGIAAL